MESYFANLFEDIRHERSLILLLSLTDEGILIQAGFHRKRSKYYKKYSFRKNT